MAFTKRRKQPHLFRNPAVDPTKQVAAQLEREAAAAEAQSATAPVVVTAKKKRATKSKVAKRR